MCVLNAYLSLLNTQIDKKNLRYGMVFWESVSVFCRDRNFVPRKDRKKYFIRENSYGSLLSLE
jgi:hypothetical protein